MSQSRKTLETTGIFRVVSIPKMFSQKGKEEKVNAEQYPLFQRNPVKKNESSIWGTCTRATSSREGIPADVKVNPKSKEFVVHTLCWISYNRLLTTRYEL
jgi:hypothetical protein